ncbi:MAG: ABC transporter permease, partial [Sphingomonadales bacterium]
MRSRAQSPTLPAMDDVLAISAGADGAGTVLTLAGPLTMAGIGPASARLADLVATGPLAIDMAGVTALDTAGAWALHRVQQRWQLAGQPCRITGLAPQGERLLAEIARHDVPVPIRPPAPPFLLGRLDRIGGAVADAIGNIGTFLGFLGQVMVVLGLTLLGRRRLRWHALVHQCELVGVNALGIIALLLFLVGLVVAQQGAVQLRQFGAEVFTVNLIGRATTRELGILLTAIMVAGRSGAAFAAQLGSMKLNQEVDALATIGMSPIEVLVVPRVLACALMLMLLAFWGGVMALIGGGAFVWLDFDL